jgi:hypothetical protein
MKKIIFMLVMISLQAKAAYHVIIDPKEVATKTVEDMQSYWRTGVMSRELAEKIHTVQSSDKEMSKEEAMDIVITKAQSSMQ